MPQPQKKIHAIFFDLFGTLIANYRVDELEESLDRMAIALGIDSKQFKGAWYETFDARCLGKFSSIRENLIKIASDLQRLVLQDSLEEAIRIREEFAWRGLNRLFPDALDTLSELKRRELKIALISDCSYEVPERWQETKLAPFFDLVVFSCNFKIKKPDPRIYVHALNSLGLEPQNVLYIGDGGSHELAGAQNVGLRPFLLEHKDASPLDHRVNVESWRGPTIYSLTEILTLP